MSRRKQKQSMESQFDVGLLIITLCLVGFGMLMIYSTSSYTSQVKYNDSLFFLKKQAIGVITGIFAMFIVSKFHYKLFVKKLPIIKVRFVTFTYFIALTMQTLVLFIGTVKYGAKRWIHIGSLSIQPSEISKVATILMVAYLIQKNPRIMSYFKGIFRVMIPIFLLLVLVVVENLSTAIIIAMISIGMCFISAKSRRLYVLVMAVLVGIGSLIIKLGEGFRGERIDIWLNVEGHEKGFQILQGLYAIASGGIFGVGLGESMQKLGFIPESHNDMIFSIICEELGLVGAGVVILMFGLLIWKIFKIASTAPDLFSGMICTGVMIHIAAQVIINIAVVTNSMPSTGIPLPFISYGGTSISILLAEMGLVLGISARRKNG